ncbi:MAG: SpoIIIAC/SpoIIIAD family protein [Clostridia bacterium]|nr:SpoIIIAC/SpoIIIAD family protein [Clostridia bacterium]MDR3645560.1 SpoIIIAC/SpoIIIAD family protein [Clostridia bacterium]
MLNIAGIAVVAAAIAVLLRQYKQEYAMLVGLATGIVVFLFVLAKAQPAFDEISSLLSGAGISSEYAQILIKALGICFVTQLASDSCRDAGEAAIASKVELAGKFTVLLLALPLFEQIAKLAIGLIG